MTSVMEPWWNYGLFIYPSVRLSVLVDGVQRGESCGHRWCELPDVFPTTVHYGAKAIGRRSRPPILLSQQQQPATQQHVVQEECPSQKGES
jgi:hypothetical protein